MHISASTNTKHFKLTLLQTFLPHLLNINTKLTINSSLKTKKHPTYLKKSPSKNKHILKLYSTIKYISKYFLSSPLPK